MYAPIVWGWDFSLTKTIKVGLPSCLTGLKSLLLRDADAFGWTEVQAPEINEK